MPRWRASTGEWVKFRRRWGREAPAGISIYEEWRAPSADAAMEFLNTRSIREQQYYVVVETPSGIWGKDRMGVYQER